MSFAIYEKPDPSAAFSSARCRKSVQVSDAGEPVVARREAERFPTTGTHTIGGENPEAIRRNSSISVHNEDTSVNGPSRVIMEGRRERWVAHLADCRGDIVSGIGKDEYHDRNSARESIDL